MIEQFTLEQARERTNNINSWVQAAPQRYAAEYYGSFNEFIEKLSSNVTEANAAVQDDENAQNIKLRAQLTYAAAIFRDCKYSLVNRGRLQELGIHNMYREAYEVARPVAYVEDL